MSYVLTETAKVVVASAADFIVSGRTATPSVMTSGLWYDVLDSQGPYDAAMAEKPITVAVVNGWLPTERIAWMMNTFLADERYASGWNIARRAMAEFPAEFSQELDHLWHERAAKNWRGSSL